MLVEENSEEGQESNVPPSALFDLEHVGEGKERLIQL